MPYLSPVADSPTDRLIRDIQQLKLGKLGDRHRPHKLLLLLAVIELINAGALHENRIYFNDDLKTSFRALFERHKKRGDRERPARPFFHLRSAPFWHHQVKEGREKLYETMTSDECFVRENIAYAYLSDEAFWVFADEKSNSKIADALHLMVLRKC